MEILDHILANDPEISEELRNRNRAFGLPSAKARGISREAVESTINRSVVNFNTEAVILFEGRPSLLIKDDGFAPPSSTIWRERLAPAESALRRAIMSVGRIELVNHPLAALAPFVGTGWMVSDDVIVTNRHVVDLFGLREGDTFRFTVDPATGDDVIVRIDFKEEHGHEAVAEIGIARIIHIESQNGPDMAFLKLQTEVGHLPAPLVLGDHKEDEFIASIGYPGRDPRVLAAELRPIFGDIFNVKRIAPGMVMPEDDVTVFRHDCSTLKGSSGSVVISLDSGAAVGLHFAGEFGFANFAVKAKQLKDKLARLNISVPVSRPKPSLVIEEPAAEQPGQREGYQMNFLGSHAAVPMPGLGAETALRFDDDKSELKYTHFSVIMHAERKLALCAACNIDGQSLRRVPRANRWRLDERIGIEQQHGNALYRHNVYDRGHVVRRLSPVWGDLETAKQANADTFFYPNAVPQHEQLNQKFWLGLEDYILDNAKAEQLRVSVFTGSVFDPGDPVYRDVAIPRQFWKIVAFLNQEDNKLRASGYLMDQTHLISEVAEEFIFGAYKTYQVSIAKIARDTQLDFGSLIAADVLGHTESLAGLTPITRFEDIIF